MRLEVFDMSMMATGAYPSKVVLDEDHTNYRCLGFLLYAPCSRCSVRSLYPPGKARRDWWVFFCITKSEYV